MKFLNISIERIRFRVYLRLHYRQSKLFFCLNNLSVALLLNVFLQLVKDYRNNEPNAVGLLQKYEFHIMPVANPGIMS